MQKVISQVPKSKPRALLFDFDGTLVDSAPDLAGAANDLRVELGLELMPYTVLRPYATYGARSLLKQALDLSPGVGHQLKPKLHPQIVRRSGEIGRAVHQRAIEIEEDGARFGLRNLGYSFLH